jgi:CRISPR system Cascade subunit CasE
MGLIGRPDQETWLARMGEMHGFALPTLAAVARADACASRIDVSVTQEQMLRGRQHGGNGIRVYGVLYDGILSVTDPGAFTKAIADGIGHGKSLGLGLLSVAPIS